MTTTMKEYLADSARTAIETGVEIRKDVFPTPLHFLYDLTMLVEAGCNADLVKRSIFYKEEIAKSQARGYGYTIQNKKLYDQIHVDQLMEEKEEDKSKHLTLTDDKINLIHAALGVISEAGEVLEEVIKSSLEKRDMDFTNLKEEGGDFLWYVALYLRAAGTDFETAAASNIKKLAVRYPEKFSSEAALNRDLDKEREALEVNDNDTDQVRDTKTA